MREYGIRGFGVNYDNISNYVDRAKLIDFVYEDEFNEDEALGVSNTDLVFEYIEMTDSVLDFVYADDCTGYILIWDTLPWEMWHKDYKELCTETEAKEYIWEKVSEILDGRLTKEDFFIKLDRIDDTYIG